MSNTIEHISKHNPTSGNLYFFDCNVWIYLFFPLMNVRKEKQSQYAKLLRAISSARAAIFINALMLSEISNSFLRIKFKEWAKNNNRIEADYKRDYVGTESYIEAVNDLKPILNSIFKITEFCTDNLNRMPIEDLYKNFGLCDFNDSYYIKMCGLPPKCILVTDDKDFINPKVQGDIKIVTDNKI